MGEIKEVAQQDHKWYVVRAISGQEKKIRQYLETEISRLGLEHKVPQVLIPMEKVIQLRAGKKVFKERNYFPGYILIQAELDGELIDTIRNVTGVIGFLGAGNQPVPLRQNEVNRILGKVDEMQESDEVMGVNYHVGEPVKVMDGPFNGFSGVVEEVNEEKKKLKVMVKIFGRKTPLELTYMQVEKE